MIATSSRHATSRGQALHLIMLVSKSLSEVAAELIPTTSVLLTLGKGPRHAVKDVALRCDEFARTCSLHNL